MNHILLKLSRSHALQMLGIFSDVPKVDEVMNPHFRDVLPVPKADEIISSHFRDVLVKEEGTRLVKAKKANVYTTRGSDGNFLHKDWYVVLSIPTDVVFTDLHIDFFGLQIDKLEFED